MGQPRRSEEEREEERLEKGSDGRPARARPQTDIRRGAPTRPPARERSAFWQIVLFIKLNVRVILLLVFICFVKTVLHRIKLAQPRWNDREFPMKAI